ncbi:putative DsbA family dithiol-disulfide isomerase [Fontibacillus solani]|uniref:Putative DsbA family dithiol-disulfide isomerase n=1 Tax=Fontibacillus solani TaxID=1572857 RepID=A0A7W3STE5_9BACL|nr:DsbA family oxidoreductase [Fontibacillus solani]MBA9085902.1 putative DsbA family dithiol-disulfide isomerase [Fontibacillus solani]
MNVEIWSDITCPFCYIGKRYFEQGLAKFEHKDKVNVIYRSFQLDPHAPKQPTDDVYTLVANKYGYSREQVKGMHDNLVAQARLVGLDYRFDHALPANSLDAHRVIKFADTYGKSEDILEQLYKAYFTDSKLISDWETLADLAAETGIPREDVLSMLNSTKYEEEVLTDGRDASSFGATGVPFFVFNRKYAVSGAQPGDVFLGALQTAWDEVHPIISLNPEAQQADQGQICEDGYCIPNNPSK